MYVTPARLHMICHRGEGGQWKHPVWGAHRVDAVWERLSDESIAT
jgi:hypothetical protein